MQNQIVLTIYFFHLQFLFVSFSYFILIFKWNGNPSFFASISSGFNCISSGFSCLKPANNVQEHGSCTLPVRQRALYYSNSPIRHYTQTFLSRRWEVKASRWSLGVSASYSSAFPAAPGGRATSECAASGRVWCPPSALARSRGRTWSLRGHRSQENDLERKRKQTD